MKKMEYQAGSQIILQDFTHDKPQKREKKTYKGRRVSIEDEFSSISTNP